jgi:hypothetical protein
MSEPECSTMWGTVGVAIGSWAPTVRLVIVLIVITICYVLAMTVR